MASEQHNPGEAIRLVEEFLQTELEARALATAFELGWIDRLQQSLSVPRDNLRRDGAMPGRNADLLLDILAGAGVVGTGDSVQLSDRFRSTLHYRDLLEAKLWFAGLVAPDVHEHFTALLTDVPLFMAKARVFELFRYDRCLEVTRENIASTRRWVRYTTVLTRYEAPAALQFLDLTHTRRLLDVGGNSGEFARQACARFPQLRATVFDLPVVCELGREHVFAAPEAGRIRFVPGDLRREALPPGHDAVTFKSVLHDWPDEHAAAFLEKATAALEPGGRIVIFERTPLAPGRGRIPYSMVANLVFLPFFRDPSFYRMHLERLGFRQIEETEVDLETPFVLLTARKAA